MTLHVRCLCLYTRLECACHSSACSWHCLDDGASAVGYWRALMGDLADSLFHNMINDIVWEVGVGMCRYECGHVFGAWVCEC